MATPVSGAENKNDNRPTAAPRHPVSISVKYWLPGSSDPDAPTDTCEWNETNVPTARIGLPAGSTHPSKPEAGDYAYSGMHDQGPLPKPREGGPMASLIACVLQAKQTNDEFLTRVIEEEKATKEEHKGKRAKTEV